MPQSTSTPIPPQKLIGCWAIALNGDAAAAASARERLARDFHYPPYAALRAGGLEPERAAGCVDFVLRRFMASTPCDSVRSRKPLLRDYLLELVQTEAAPHRAESADLLDPAQAESQFLTETRLKPREMFLHTWAMTLLQRTMTLIRKSQAEAGESDRFEKLKPFLGYSGGEPAYEALARDLGISIGCAHKEVYDFRVLYRETLRGQIARTVADAGAINAELGALTAAV